jgi:small subunit ribosomal protein S7
VYDCFDIISAKTKKDPMLVFEKAIKNVGPSLEVRGRRIGGANYQIPYPVREERRYNLSCRWLLDAARSRKGRSMAERLAQELIDASEEMGEAYKKKENVHKMAEANRAFAHFARF